LEDLVHLGAEVGPFCGQTPTSTRAARLLVPIESLSKKFSGEGLAIYARKTGTPGRAKDPWPAICRQVHEAAGLPAVEARFSRVWSREAKLVLPSNIPELHAGAIWGPVLAYCVLEGMAEAIGETNTAATALALFDRLRLREPLARAFSLGEISEDGWRAAARVRLLFLNQMWTSAKPAKGAEDEPFAGFPRLFWEDGDARWLLKVHEAAGEWYFNKELHQQILWWAQLPDLLPLAAPAPTPANDGKAAAAGQIQIKAIERQVKEASEQAEEAGYRVGKRKVAKPAKREKRALAK
jgi:hypothetical protein